MPDPAMRRVERHRRQLAGVRRMRSRDNDHRLRAMLPRRHRLVAQVGVSREDAFRLAIGVLWKIAEDDDDLVLDVERRVAVVRESLAFRDDDPVAGEHCRRLSTSPLSEKESARTCVAAASDRAGDDAARGS